MKPMVFIQANPPQYLGAKVSEYSLRKASATPGGFDTRILTMQDFPHLTKREGREYRRKGSVLTWRNRDLQSFTPMRFLPPQLMGFEGRALVIDPDVFALGDVHDLLTRDMGGKAIVCRRVQPANSRPAFYASSVMLLDCEKLRHWRWDRQIDELFSGQWDYGDWVSLRFERPESIGELEAEWNHFDVLDRRTKLLHCTERVTQPWKTGLPIDFDTNYRMTGRKAWLPALKRLLGRAPAVTRGFYRPHPDVNQQRLFFTLLAECLRDGVVTEEELRREMSLKYLRGDALSILKNLKPFDRATLPDRGEPQEVA